MSIIANRLSYFLTCAIRRGVDTACSSSLVAIHLACQSLLTQDWVKFGNRSAGVNSCCCPRLWLSQLRPSAPVLDRSVPCVLMRPPFVCPAARGAGVVVL